MSISKEFIVNLRGKDYPTWPGALDAATKAGLRSLTTRIVQIPSPENGHLAVVVARAEFEDGRVFEDVGDCSPQSTSPQLAAAALRLASTRAKGRVLRDAINVGQTLLEELPDLDEVPEAASHGAPRSGQPLYVAEPSTRPVKSEAPPAAPRPAPAERSRAAATRSDGASVKEAAAPAANGNGKMECSNPGCGKPLTKGQHDVSLRSYGQPLCPSCQKQHARVG